MSRQLEFDLPDPGATGDLGANLAVALPVDAAGWLILLKGDLGSGKSTLARSMLRRLGVEGPVPSPTYTLVEPYEIESEAGGETGERLVYHVDLYRISEARELRYLGWSELRQGLVLVEWPDRLPGIDDEADLDVLLDFGGHGGRTALVRALSARAERVLDGMLPPGPGRTPAAAR